MRQYNVESDLVLVRSLQPVVYKQYDNGDKLKVELYQDGDKINLKNETILAFFQLEDGTVIQKTCSIESGNAIATLDNNILSQNGTVKAEFTVYDGNRETTTRTILIDVESSINRNEAIESVPQWDIVDQLLDLKDSDGQAIGQKIDVLIDAVKAKFEELSTAQQVDSEVITARDGEASLGIRLNKFNQQLADFDDQLVDKADIGIVKDFRDGFYAGPVVAFVFDDGRKEMWNLFKTLFESEGVPANVPVVTDSIDTNPNYMTTSQLKELQELGWGISSHTATHIDVNNATPEEIDREYRKSSQWLKKNGFSHDIIVYPYGSTNAIARKIASKYYKMGVNIVRNNLSNDIPNIDNLNLTRLAGFSQPPGAEPTYNEVKQRFDIGLVRNELMIYEDHPQYAIWTPEKIEELRTFIRYIKSKGVPIVTLDDAFQMKCNIIDVGERSESSFYKLHRNGQVSGGSNTFNLASSDAYNASNSVHDYPNGKITKFRINNTLSGLPIQSSGEIIMDKTSPYENNWKMDYYSDGLVFYRLWRNNSWTRWYSYGEVVGDAHTSTLPVANVSNWRRMLLVRGHNGQEDKFVVCTRNANSTYSWKVIALAEYT